jgi:hypothetical protein
LNTTQKNYALFQIRFAHMGPAHGPEKGPVPGHNPHPADPAAAVAAPVMQGSPAGMDHRRQNRLFAGTGKTFPRILYSNLIPLPRFFDQLFIFYV